MKNIALVVGGSGMKSAYSGGALVALTKELKLTNPDIVIGSSGGSGGLPYYVAGQYDSIKRIWSELLATKKFISLMRVKRILDLDYLIDNVVKKVEPLNIEIVIGSKIKLLIPATDWITGEPYYFSNKDDIYKAMKASKAIPGLFNEIIRINHRRYIDGQLSATVERNIQKAIDEGATKIIVIDVSESSLISKIFWKTYMLFVPKRLGRTVLAFLRNSFKHTPKKGVDVFYITASQKIPAGTLSINREDLIKTFELGYNDVVQNKELREFLK
jgi:predicted patatin/cPLA2 family phospholipase